MATNFAPQSAGLGGAVGPQQQQQQSPQTIQQAGGYKPAQQQPPGFWNPQGYFNQNRPPQRPSYGGGYGGMGPRMPMFNPNFGGFGGGYGNPYGMGGGRPRGGMGGMYGNPYGMGGGMGGGFGYGGRPMFGNPYGMGGGYWGLGGGMMPPWMMGGQFGDRTDRGFDVGLSPEDYYMDGPGTPSHNYWLSLADQARFDPSGSYMPTFGRRPSSYEEYVNDPNRRGDLITEAQWQESQLWEANDPNRPPRPGLVWGQRSNGIGSDLGMGWIDPNAPPSR